MIERKINIPEKLLKALETELSFLRRQIKVKEREASLLRDQIIQLKKRLSGELPY